ncbi:hypothetical protein [Streptomyces sp. 3N207]|uniref:hypothetical protein n=1 Tax=Streptomyces sp. 3N207 TaxID=3457417 RepID=UPI003FD0AB77
MAFSHRIATLTAVVAIPLGIAATSYALTDSPDPPRPPAKVELDSESPSAERPSGKKPEPSSGPSKGSSRPSGDETVRPPATDDTSDDDRSEEPDDRNDDGGRDDQDDGPGDDG